MNCFTMCVVALSSALALSVPAPAQSTSRGPSQAKQRPPTRAVATGVPTYTFSTTILLPQLQKTETALRMAAAFAEADEVLRIADGPDDGACAFHFARGPVTKKTWNKHPRPNESDADLASRRSNHDVEYEEDYKEVEAAPGSIKVVGRIDYCKREGAAMLERTEILGCSFENGTFMIAAGILPDAPRRGIVVAHEYGHNVCNYDTGEPEQIMYREGGSDPARSRRVTAEQCRRYTAPKGSLCPPSRRNRARMAARIKN